MELSEGQLQDSPWKYIETTETRLECVAYSGCIQPPIVDTQYAAHKPNQTPPLSRFAAGKNCFNSSMPVSSDLKPDQLQIPSGLNMQSRLWKLPIDLVSMTMWKGTW